MNVYIPVLITLSYPRKQFKQISKIIKTMKNIFHMLSTLRE